MNIFLSSTEIWREIKSVKRGQKSLVDNVDYAIVHVSGEFSFILCFSPNRSVPHVYSFFVGKVFQRWSNVSPSHPGLLAAIADRQLPLLLRELAGFEFADQIPCRRPILVVQYILGEDR